MALDSSGWTREYDASLPEMSGNWYAGILGSYGYEWEVSDTMYFETCSWGPLLQSESTAAGYLYFDAAGGGITKLGTTLTSWWTIADLPDPVTGSSKAITCAGRGDQIENLWLINQNGQLEQWWLNATAVDGNDSPLAWNRGKFLILWFVYMICLIYLLKRHTIFRDHRHQYQPRSLEHPSQRHHLLPSPQQ
jgi:hypothetical protein